MSTPLTSYLRRSLQSLAVSAAAVVALALHIPDAVWWAVNPWDLSIGELAVCYVVKCAALKALDVVIQRTVEWFAPPLLQYRVNNSKAAAAVQRDLEAIDYFFLAINSVIETVFLFHLASFIATHPRIERGLGGIGILNTLPALWLTLVVNDGLYAPMHYAMHHWTLYPYIHK
eukprot:Sspe_Gene.28916::Locus_13373_Transcript_1_1_Confidence_1.000_Length_549::g.28916::m.28916